jgi:hypothetical protein
MMVVLIETEVPDVSLDAKTISALGGLGITNLAVVRDERTVGLVLEGWAFDPPTSSEAALAMLGGGDGARVLYPLGEMAVTANRAERSA